MTLCNCIPYLLCASVFVPLFLLSTAFAFLNELQLADLITSEEWEELSDINDVVAVQSGKSTAVMTKTADVLRRLGFEKESRLLTGI